MSRVRIAHFGTFDIESYGDLLFPLVAQKRLAGLGAELVCVSPVGGPPVWGDCAATVSPDALEDGDLDGVLLGGGNVVSVSPADIDHYRQDGLTWLLAYSRLWAESARFAAARGIPLCWNAPGVPGLFAPPVAQLLRTAANSAAYASVRDQYSLGNLHAAGIDRRVHLVPDTAFDVADLFPAGALEEAFGRVFSDRNRDVPERVLAVHVSGRQLDCETGAVARQLDQIASVTDSTLLLLALERCHGDDDVARSVADALNAEHVVLDRPASLREVVAAIGRADAYAGSSPHG